MTPPIKAPPQPTRAGIVGGWVLSLGAFWLLGVLAASVVTWLIFIFTGHGTPFAAFMPLSVLCGYILFVYSHGEENLPRWIKATHYYFGQTLMYGFFIMLGGGFWLLVFYLQSL